MNRAVAIRELVHDAVIRILLIVGFDITFPVIDEDANRAYRNRVTLLHPDNLPIMVNWLHTVTGYTQAELGTSGDRGFRKANHLEISFFQELTSTGGYGKVTDGYINKFDNITAFCMQRMEYWMP